jgi:hypothetical protein
MAEVKKIDLGNSSCLFVRDDGYGCARIGIGYVHPPEKMPLYAVPHLKVLIEKLEALREELERPKFESVTIDITDRDVAMAVMSAIGKTSPNDNAMAADKTSDQDVQRIGKAVQTIYAVLREATDGHPG